MSVTPTRRSIALALGGLIVALLMGVIAPAVARAQSPNVKVEQGLSEFQDLEFAQAISTLEGVVRDPAATPSQRLLALELIAISHLSLRQSKRAEEAFARLLRLRPNYELRNHDGSPKVIAVFEKVKARLERAKASKEKPKPDPKSTPTPLVLSWPPLPVGQSGRKMAIMAIAEGTAPTAMRLHWKVEGADSYETLPMRRVKGVRWRAKIRLPKSAQPYGIAFYAEALGPAGEVLGLLSSQREPATTSVAGRAVGISSARPWYKSWKVWAGVGAVTFLGGTAAILSSGSDLREGGLSPGRITLSP